MGDGSISMIAQTIQLAVTPVFLLVAIGSLLNVFTGRLARIVDRVRMLEDDVLTAEEARRREEIGELSVLSRRMSLCQWAIAMCTLSAVLVCLMVMVLFAAATAALDFTWPVTVLFVMVTAALTLGLSLFFIEVSVATRTVQVREEYVKSARKRRDR